MADHVMAEELFTYILMSVLVLALLGTLLQGAIWHYRLRQSASVPLLLMPPAKEVLCALLLGIALPMAVYWAYSRLPGIGGREFGWLSGMRTRFIVELCVLGIIMLWLPAHIIRGYIRRRCMELDIELPGRKEESSAGWKVRGAALTALIFASIAILLPADTGPVLRTCLAIAIIALLYRYARGEHGGHSLYYGTLAKSLAPVYAVAVIFISLTVQPWLLYNEAHWLRQDKMIYGYLANPHNISAFTAPEAKSTQRLNELIREALK